MCLCMKTSSNNTIIVNYISSFGKSIYAGSRRNRSQMFFFLFKTKKMLIIFVNYLPFFSLYASH